jgi:hypothetical protein
MAVRSLLVLPLAVLGALLGTTRMPPVFLHPLEGGGQSRTVVDHAGSLVLVRGVTRLLETQRLRRSSDAVSRVTRTRSSMKISMRPGTADRSGVPERATWSA